MIEALRLGAGYSALLALALVIWFVVGTAADGHHRVGAVLQRIYLAALVLRLLVAVGTYYFLPYGYFAPDELGYATGAQSIVESGRVNLGLAINGYGWIYFNALLFHVFGTDFLLPRVWNCLVGATTPVLCYLIAKRCGAGVGAIWSAILLAGYPSLVLWSALDLKDADVHFLILAGLALGLHLQVATRIRYQLGLVLALGALYTMRQFAFWSLLVGVLAGFLVSGRAVFRFAMSPGGRRPLVAAGALVAALAAGTVVVAPGVFELLYQRLALTRLATIRYKLSVGARSAIHVDPGLQTFKGALVFLPTGLVDFFLRPFPWESAGGFNLLTRFETGGYYALLAIAVVGLAYGLMTGTVKFVPLLGFLVVAGIGYALVLSNLGTIYRERDQVIIVLLVFVGVGINALRGAVLSRRSTALQ